MNVACASRVRDLSWIFPPTLLFPTLGADRDGRLLLSFYASDESDVLVRRMAVGGDGLTDATDWSGPVPVSSPFGIPIVGRGDAPTRALGDYDDTTAVDPLIYPSGSGSFAAAFTVRSRGTSETAVSYVGVIP
jgi:hypothetical protein